MEIKSHSCVQWGEYRFLKAGEKVVRESSVEVGFFWKGATCSSDDDVGGVVCCLHTLIQWFLLDQLRQITCRTVGNDEEESTKNTGKATSKLIM